jgi:putative ABC transport system substrate-binding protein
VNNRRKLIVALGAGALAAPGLCFAAETPLPRRIGMLRISDESLPEIAAFKQAMQILGYIDGKDFSLEMRSAQGDVKKLPALAAELVALRMDLIITTGTPNALAVRAATRDIPIVLVTTSDPVGSGLIASLAHPGGNITGVANLTSEIAIKRLELLRDILPSARRVGFLHNSESPADVNEFKLVAAAGEKLGMRVIAATYPIGGEAAPIFEMLKRSKADGIIVTSGANLTRRITIVEQANKHRLPSVYAHPSFVVAGGLICYTADWPDQYRRAASYVDKIFKGARPANLPVEQPTRFDLIVNMKTAKTLGIKIPNSILVRATQVIE